MKLVKFSSLALVVAFAAGCGQPAPEPEAPPATVPPLEVKPNAPVGIKVDQSQDPTSLATVALVTARKAGPARPDPFMLKPYEKQYETDQETERLYAQSGDFAPAFTPPAEEQEKAPPVVEPQPYRRLSGIVVGDSILAIIDMGDGRVELIRPGQMIPGTEWKVVSIDEEKAVLRRGGKVLPHEVTVRLELPPPGMGNSGPSFGPRGGNNGGPPFGPPPGRGGNGGGLSPSDGGN